jgi:tetratricopeptide (TPR) repeat protein
MVAYAAFALVATIVLLQLPSLDAPLAATVGSLAVVALAPFVGGLAILPWPRSSHWRRLALALAAPTIGLALLLNWHQLAALAADTAFKRAQTAESQHNFVAAIAATQDALRFAPDQGEYYNLLGQYYAALAGGTSAPAAASFQPSLEAALGTRQAGSLGRDQLFELGRVSAEEAIHRNPLEVRYHLTLGELHRYWAEVGAEPAHLAAALASFERAAALKPNDVEIHAGIADALLLSADPSRAVTVGQHAKDLLPTYWYPYAVLARAYLAIGEPAEALQAAQDALYYVPWSPTLKRPSPYDLDRLQTVISAAQAAL